MKDKYEDFWGQDNQQTGQAPRPQKHKDNKASFKRGKLKTKFKVGVLVFVVALIFSVIYVENFSSSAIVEAIASEPQVPTEIDAGAEKMWQDSLLIIQNIADDGSLIPNDYIIKKIEIGKAKEAEATRAEAEKKQSENNVYEYVHGIATGKTAVACKTNGSIHKNTEAKGMVAITFDDGPYKKMTAEYLKVLDDNDAVATFFVLGQYLLNNPEISRNIAAQGSEVASHSWYHHNLPKMSAEDISEDFRKTDAAFNKVLGYSPSLFRAPYGALNGNVKAISTQYAEQSVLWSIDPEDWRAKSSDKVYNHIMNRVTDGSIILLHENKKVTLEVLPKLIQGLKAKGYQLVTVSDLIYQSSNEAKAVNTK